MLLVEVPLFFASKSEVRDIQQAVLCAPRRQGVLFCFVVCFVCFVGVRVLQFVFYRVPHMHALQQQRQGPVFCMSCVRACVPVFVCFGPALVTPGDIFLCVLVLFRVVVVLCPSFFARKLLLSLMLMLMLLLLLFHSSCSFACFLSAAVCLFLELVGGGGDARTHIFFIACMVVDDNDMM